MPEDRVDRRLAAILAADIAGYSRLMGAVEVPAPRAPPSATTARGHALMLDQIAP